MTWGLALLLGGLLLGVNLRGGAFHNHLVHRSVETFRHAGFDVALECPRRLPDGRVNFIDILARRGDLTLACEIETTGRWALRNTDLAFALGLPLWIVVPSRDVRDAVQRKLAVCAEGEHDRELWISLLSGLPGGLAAVFPVFPEANPHMENRNNARCRKSELRAPLH